MDDKKTGEEQVTEEKKPSATSTPERVAAAAKANTAKPVAKKPAEKKPEKKPETEEVEVKTTASADKVDFTIQTTIQEYVDLYNEMVLTAKDLGVKNVTTVKSFDSLKTGRLACERLHAAIMAKRDTPAEPPKKETTMSKKAKKTVKTAKKTAKQAKAKGAPRSKFDPAAKITWVAGKENPAREGSGRFERIEMVRKASGKTVETFLKTGRSGSLAWCVKQKLAKVG